MMEFILSIDTSLFWVINATTHNVVFDKIMPFVTERNNWFLLYIFLFFYFFTKLGKEGKVAAILTILAVTLSDQTTSSIFKPLIERLRPCHELEGVRLLVGCGGKYGLPSSHAANFFAAATMFNFFFPKYRWVYFSIAFIVAYSRVYVGVHYPLDVIVGGLIGVISAFLVSLLYKYFESILSSLMLRKNN